MTHRKNLITKFLNQNNINNYEVEEIAGDASSRSYFRIKKKDASFITMDDYALENIKSFYKIDKFLIENNFLAPKIFAKDFENGFLLLEDFGDHNLRKILEKSDENNASNLYKQAINLLIDLRRVKPLKDLPTYNQNLLLKEAMLFIDWYLPFILKKPASIEQIKQFQNILTNLFSKLSTPNTLTLRDYHADNLMIIKDKSDDLQLGLLDFQDAVIGNAAYDLVSLLEDARIDVPKNLQKNLLEYYLQKSNSNSEEFLIDYQILSIQRNLKIIGIFSRLAIRDEKTQYLNFLPRVFGYVNSGLQHNSLSELRKLLSIFI
jgi:hypothetical protein